MDGMMTTMHDASREEQLIAEVAHLRGELSVERRDRRIRCHMVLQRLDIVREITKARRVYSQRPGGEDMHLISHSLVVRATELLTIPPMDPQAQTHTTEEG